MASTFKVLLKSPSVYEDLAEAYEAAEKFMAQIGKEFRREDAKPVLDMHVTGDNGEHSIGLAWEIHPTPSKSVWFEVDTGRGTHRYPKASAFRIDPETEYLHILNGESVLAIYNRHSWKTVREVPAESDDA